ncbi:MAG: MerR family transcriptional regulator [Nannocystaceae bacterium]|nr:MerR family transcriptional regulator [Nannocystaceae bacterium]
MTRRKASGSSDGAGLDLGSDKLYFKIGEVAEIVGVPAYVLRYWETEFRAVKPQKSRTQQRVYRRRDVETLLKIKQLLYMEKFTIAGARQKLKEASAGCRPAAPSGVYLAKQSLSVVRRLLDDTRAMAESGLTDPAAADPARFLREVGGARALLEDAEGSLLDRPARPPRRP